jgi:hypothetical protein
VLQTANRMLRGRYTSEDVVAEWLLDSLPGLRRRFVQHSDTAQSFQAWLVDQARDRFPYATTRTLHRAATSALNETNLT